MEASSLQIVRVGDPVLREKAKPVKRISASIRHLLDDMYCAMKAANGIGLAAPQIGVPKRVIVVDIGQGLHEIINPEIQKGEGSEVALEGCLSVPGWVGEVERFESVRVTGIDREGRQVWLDGSGLLARVLQHEIDHLDGVLFTDKARTLMEAKADDEAEEAEDLPAQHQAEQRAFRIVYMGTPDFALEPLRALLLHGHQIVLTVTQPDRPGNRGRIKESSVKRFAMSQGLPIAQPESVREPSFIEAVSLLKPDFIVVAAFGQKLPRKLMAQAKYGAVNVHASLLPKYRGAAPVQHALLNGDTSAGATIMLMNEGLDTGDIISQQAVDISDCDDAGTLLEKVSSVGASLLPGALRALAEGSADIRPQQDALASYAPRLTSADETIDWSQDAKSIALRVRALSPAPGARTFYGDLLVKIWKTEEISGVEVSGSPGLISRGLADEMIVLCGNGALRITEIQPSGKRKMSGAEFIRGYRPIPGAAFRSVPATIEDGR